MMALCRFSDYQCDLYIYESALGIECHVARSRYENEPELSPSACLNSRKPSIAWVSFIVRAPFRAACLAGSSRLSAALRRRFRPPPGLSSKQVAGYAP